MADGGYGGSAPSLDSLFRGKAKKKIKPMNFNPAFKAAGPTVPKGPAAALRPMSGSAFTAPSSSTEGWARELKKDQDLLKSCGLWVKEVEGDGACLFRAFADQLVTDEPDAYAQMRERCVDFMEAHREDFEPFIDDKNSSWAANRACHSHLQGCHSPVSDNRCIDQELKLAHAWDCVQRNSKSVQTEDNGDVPRSREATRDVEVHWRRARNLSRAGIAMRSLLQEIREGRARLCESESPVRAAVRVRSWSDATVIPCPEGIHQKHAEASASSSSHGWQRARQLARTVNVMGHLLDDVRSKQTESVYSTDWTRVPHSSSPAARAHWHRLRSAADTGQVFQNMLNGVRSRHTEEDFEGYCSRMRQKCTWGGHVEVQALARLNGVNAVIYQPSQASGKPDQILR
ncbi:Otud3, partial [Symbiodinium sp. CCMP2456]